MKNINKPIPHPLRYELLSKNIFDETPSGPDDLNTIPAISNVVRGLGNENKPGVVSAKQKDELWRYNANLVFEVGDNIVRSRLTFQAGAFNDNLQQDMDLLNENRSLIHTGKFLRQPDTGFEWGGWTELFALLFDNYRRGLDILDVFLTYSRIPP